MLFYRYLYDSILAGETFKFSVSPPVPSPEGVLLCVHLPHKECVLKINYAGKEIVDLNTTDAVDDPPPLPLNLVVDRRRHLFCSLKNTTGSPVTTYISFCWNTKWKK